jgi:hypothetical protein
LTVTDACGNVDSISHNVNVINSIPPSMPIQANLVQDCNAPSLPAAPSASSLCSNASVQDLSHRTNGECSSSYILNRVFQATDLCGNSDMLNYTITVRDARAPIFTSFPADTTVQCTPPAASAVQLADLCDTNPLLAGPFEQRIPGTCSQDYTLLRTWSACDHCGNCVNRTQTNNVQNVLPPTWTSALPINEAFNCSADYPVQPTAVDACGNPINVIHSAQNQTARYL